MAPPNPLEALSDTNSIDLSNPAMQQLYSNLVDGFLVGAKQRKRQVSFLSSMPYFDNYASAKLVMRTLIRTEVIVTIGTTLLALGPRIPR